MIHFGRSSLELVPLRTESLSCSAVRRSSLRKPATARRRRLAALGAPRSHPVQSSDPSTFDTGQSPPRDCWQSTGAGAGHAARAVPPAEPGDALQEPTRQAQREQEPHRTHGRTSPRWFIKQSWWRTAPVQSSAAALPQIRASAGLFTTFFYTGSQKLQAVVKILSLLQAQGRLRFTP